MKEIGRIKIKNGWIIISIEYLDLSEIIEDNSDWSYIKNVKKKIPTIDISVSRRKAHKDKMKNRCTRFTSDYILLKKITIVIEEWLSKEKPQIIYVGAIKDEIFYKRIIFYRRFFYRNGYENFDDNFAIVECVDNSFAFFWLMKRNV